MVDLSVKGVWFRYGGDEPYVLKGLSSKLPHGKVTVLLGANGEGKTTLLKILLKILAPERGTVKLNGTDLRDMGRRDISGLLAWVPQAERAIFPHTVKEFLLLGRTPHLGFLNTPSEEDVRKVDEVLEELGIGGLRGRKITELSGGENRLVSIGRGLSQEPSVLLLDEPTAHLDLGNKEKVLGEIRNMADFGRTVIFSTHDPNEAALIADNVILQKNGKVLDSGAPKRVIREGTLERIYGAKVTINEVEGRPTVGLWLGRAAGRGRTGKTGSENIPNKSINTH